MVLALGQCNNAPPTIPGKQPCKLAKIKDSAAADSARRAVPGAHIQALELENEGGKLVYSFDMKTPGKDGIDEVNVDAMTGTQVGNVGHESAASESTEAATERKAAQKKGKAQQDTGGIGGL